MNSADEATSSVAVGSRAASIARWTLTSIVILICTSLLGWTQLSFDGLEDSDSYFHTRAARELDNHGVRTEFPQAVHSTWSERYSDKDLLFHLVLIPFQRLDQGAPGNDAGVEDLVTSGKQVAIFINLLVFAALGLALHSIGAKFPAFWVFLFFAIDVNLLNSFLSVRPGHLGVAFLILEIALIIRKKGAWLAVVGALHALAHSSFVLLPVLVLAALAAHALRRESFPLRLLVWTFGGLAVATVFHPYFPNNLTLGWNQIVEVASHVWGAGTEIPPYLFGAELLAARTSHFLGTFPGFAPAVCGMLAFLVYPRRRLSTDGLALVFITGLLLVAAFLSQRFLEFFYPAAILLGARLWTELLGGLSLREAWRRSPAPFFLAAGILVFCPLAGLADGNIVALNRYVRTMPTEEIKRPAVEFLRQNVRPDDLVYHNFWWDFSILYHYRPQGRYVVALDPVFFYRHDRERFKQSLDAYQGEADDLYRMLAQDFGARWIFIQKSPQFAPFFDLVRSDTRFQKAYEDANVVIARLP